MTGLIGFLKSNALAWLLGGGLLFAAVTALLFAPEERERPKDAQKKDRP